jgi:uncharacterized protein YjcR
MNHLLSDRINNLATSQTLAMAALARELKARKDIISLSLENLISILQTLSKKQLKKRSTKITAPILQMDMLN